MQRAQRFLLGLGEAGNWPGAAKVVGEWLPVRERALGMGIFNTGAARISLSAWSAWDVGNFDNETGSAQGARVSAGDGGLVVHQQNQPPVGGIRLVAGSCRFHLWPRRDCHSSSHIG